MAKIKESLSGDEEEELYRDVLNCGDITHTALLDLSDADDNIRTEWEAGVLEENIT